MQDLLEIKDLSVKYEDADEPILYGLNLKIKKNTITLVSGPSGGGKSSLAYVLTGLIPFSIRADVNGQVIYKNTNILGKKPEHLCHELGLVMQDPEMSFCTTTVEDEIAFGLENLAVAPAKIDNIIDETLGLLNIKDLRYRQLHQLSGGEKQKVALACILAMQPEILILDEPSANLDPASARELRDLLVSLRDKHNKTIILIEHRLNFFLAIADEWVTIDKGRAWAKDLKPVRQAAKITGLRGLKNNLDLLKSEPNQGAEFPLIEIRNLFFAYTGGREVLRNINLKINRGEFVGLVGRNGSGKSTLAKLVLGLFNNYKGDIVVKGKNLRRMKRREIMQALGMVFQNPEHQFVSFRTYDELFYTLKVLGCEAKQAELKVKSCLEKFRLLEKAELSPYKLSQGEKRRLSVASMLIAGQEVLILDEPTYGQDRHNTMELMQYMKMLNEEGMTIIMITHDMEILNAYCQRAVVLNQGEIIFDGTPYELFQREEILQTAGLEKPGLLEESCEVISS